MKGFNNLELFFKKDFVNKNARFLISTTHFRHTVKLYSWDKFLIELYYDKTRSKITLIRLAGNASLAKYMKEISISNLGLFTQR